MVDGLYLIDYIRINLIFLINMILCSGYENLNLLRLSVLYSAIKVLIYLYIGKLIP